MQITVYTSFSKRKNSTKQPTGGTTVNNVELKKPTSIHEPTFVLGAITGVTMTNITYVKAFGNYYFVTNIAVTPHDYFEISCSEDPMASNKTAILASTQYVLYSASSNDPMIADNRIIPVSNEIQTSSSASTLTLSTNGCFVLTCLNSQHGNYFTSAYLLDDVNVAVLAEYLFDNTLWDGNFEAWFEKGVSHAYESVISLKWVPVTYTDISVTEVAVYLGPVAVQWTDGGGINHGVMGKLIPQSAASVISLTGTISHTWHYKDDWRLCNPYTRAKLLLPAFGLYDINPIEHRTGTTIKYAFDLISGECTIFIYGSTSQQVAEINFNLAVDIPIAQLASRGVGSVASILSGIATAAAGAATGGVAGVAAMAGGAAESVKSAVDMFSPTPSVKGNIGGRSWVGYPTAGVIEYYMDTQDLNEFNSTQGRPLMQEVTLSTLSGFCQCANASVELNCMESDRDYVNSCLNSGFFIE